MITLINNWDNSEYDKTNETVYASPLIIWRLKSNHL